MAPFRAIVLTIVSVLVATPVPSPVNSGLDSNTSNKPGKEAGDWVRFLAAARLAKSNYREPLSQEELTVRLRQLRELNERSLAWGNTRGEMWLGSLGRSAGGKYLWWVGLRTRTTASTAPKVLVICRLHGDEPASTEAALQLIKEVADGRSEHFDALDQVNLYLVPMANPDGSDLYRQNRQLGRVNGEGYDLNRHWRCQRQPENLAIQEMVRILDPDLILDCHEQTPRDQDPGYACVLGTSTGSGRVVAARARRLQAVMVEAVRGSADPSFQSVVSRNLMSGSMTHTYFPLEEGIPSVLIESEQVRGSWQPVKQRAAVHREAIWAAVEFLSYRYCWGEE